MIVSLPFPDKALWPNARPHWATKHRAAKKARADASWASRAAGSPKLSDGPIPIKIVLYPKQYGPVPDRDNIINACKSYLDGISDHLGVDDKHFAAPTVEIASERSGRVTVQVGQ